MDIVKFSIEKPVTVIVGVILVVMFGIIALQKMPYQLTPTVTEPIIKVTTGWTGATPYEIERDIIEEQENVLKGIPGLVEMESSSQNNRGEVTLYFAMGTDTNDALLRVSNKLNEVKDYPENVDRPAINATGEATSTVIWMILKTMEGNSRQIGTYKSYFENDIKQYIERVNGVSDLFVGGGREEELHVIIKPAKLAAYGLTVNHLITTIRNENVNISAGNMGVGRRDYRVRTVAEYKTPGDIEKIVLKSTGQKRVIVADVAKVSFGYSKKETVMLQNGKEGIAIGVKPEPGANVLALTDSVEEVVGWLNENRLKSRGIYIDWVYDQRPYINGAIDLVKQNIFIGGLLAITVLLLFLRDLSSTIIVGTAIPISVIGTFIFMNGMGRSLNVVSLAGISFAVGMLVDNAIVVLENIDRHRKMGKSPFDAAYEGTKEVWGAIFASTMTTVAVFLPIIFMEEEAGQLFRDIAIAVTAAVTLSLFVSISVIPMFSKQLFTLSRRGATLDRNRLTNAGQRIADLIVRLVGMAIKNWKTRIATIVIMTLLALSVTYFLFPKMEYLPQGNRNLIITFLVPPPGLSYEERENIGKIIFDYVGKYIGKGDEEYPGIRDMFFVARGNFMISGALSMEEERVRELLPLLRGLIKKIPGFFGVSNQRGIFETRRGGGRSIDIDISGDDMNGVMATAGTMFGGIMKDIQGSQIRPIPSLELLYPEVKLIPDREQLKAAGISAEDLGIILDVFMDGRRIEYFKQEGKKKIDLILKAPEEMADLPEKLLNLPLVTASGKVVPISSVARLETTVGITEIRHLERKRTVTLQLTPPDALPLQVAMEKLEDEIIPGLREKGLMKGIDVTISGAADRLTQTREALQWNLILAVFITYLLMSALFGNFIYPFIILFTVPLAAAGGILGVRGVDMFLNPQPMDVLTMVGFIILVGVVVNNAILIVYQSLNNVRERGMDYHDAVLNATKVRLRPIYMSAATSIFGMLPLVLAPGPGSELYRGLGSVVLGGLALSTVFTVFVIPALLMFFIRMEKKGQS